MKKTFSIAAILTIVIISISSCRKCTNCTKSGGSDIRLCQGDYNSNTAYGAAIDYYQAIGYQCR